MTSNGVYSFLMGKSLGQAWIEAKYANEGEDLELEHGGKQPKVKLTKSRLYDPEGTKVRG